MNSEYQLDTIAEILQMLEALDLEEISQVADMIHAHAEVSEIRRYRKGQRAYAVLSLVMGETDR